MGTLETTETATGAPAQQEIQSASTQVAKAKPDKSARFIKAAESKADKIIAEVESMRKLSHRKYYTYTDEQVEELFNAIQSSLDEVKGAFKEGTVEKKKYFTFSA